MQDINQTFSNDDEWIQRSNLNARLDDIAGKLKTAIGDQAEELKREQEELLQKLAAMDENKNKEW